MDPLDLVTDPATQAQVLFWLTAVSLSLPGLQWIADRTANKWDNALVARIAWLVSRIPRLKAGLGNTEKARATVARTSKRPPPVPSMGGMMDILVIFFPLAGMWLASQAVACAAAKPWPDDARAAASRMRADLAEVRGILSGAEGGVQMLCAVRKDTPECSTARDLVRVLSAAHKTASQSVDMVDATGVAVDSARPLVSNVLEQARALGETLKALGSEVANAVASNQVPNAGGGDPPVGPLLPQPAAPTEGAAPAAAPAP